MGREENVTKMSGEAETSQGRNIPTPEQCFYASFKIYLSDSRTNSICELEDSDSGQSEVVRIEKTLEVLDVSYSEEEKTLSNCSVSKPREDDTDVEDEDIELRQFCDKPRLVITDSDRVFKRSLSESDETQSSPGAADRNSRCLEKVSNRRYEATQSMDRANTERSPVI